MNIHVSPKFQTNDRQWCRLLVAFCPLVQCLMQIAHPFLGWCYNHLADDRNATGRLCFGVHTQAVVLWGPERPCKQRPDLHVCFWTWELIHLCECLCIKRHFIYSFWVQARYTSRDCCYWLMNRGVIVQICHVGVFLYWSSMTYHVGLINKFDFLLCKHLVVVNISRHYIPDISMGWRLRDMTPHVVSHWLRQPHLYDLRVWQCTWLIHISHGSMCFGWSLSRNATSVNPLGDLGSGWPLSFHDHLITRNLIQISFPSTWMIIFIISSALSH